MAEHITASFGFGTLDQARPEAAKSSLFRIALLGDFSGRAAKGKVEIGADLASRRPIKLDVDTIDRVIAGFATTLILPIGKQGAGIAVELNSIDDLHPDKLYESIEMFEGLVSLKRRLSNGATVDSTIAELRAWGLQNGRKVTPPARTSKGNAVPADRKLSDFAKLVGGNFARKAEATPAEDLIARIVGPYIVSVPDADNAAMQMAVDEALSGAMRLILHHPEFQLVEAQWRMLDLITRSVETDAGLDLVLYDISAEELAADLAAQDDLALSGFYQLLSAGTPDGRGPISAICGLYSFAETPPHAELLGSIARIAAHVNAPFFAAITPGFLDMPVTDRHPLVAAAWDNLRAMPDAGFLGLVSPGFLLRRPYGAKSEPIYEFEFEEFTPQEGLGGLLWANPVALVAILLAQSYCKNGVALDLGSIMTLGGIPFHVVKDQHGDQVALPCTERNLTLTKTQAAIQRGLMPVISVKGRDEIRLGSFQSLAGTTILGPWAKSTVPVQPDPNLKTSKGAIGTENLDVNTVDTELADLLAGFNDATDNGAGIDADDKAMDPDLAALLAGL